MHLTMSYYEFTIKIPSLFKDALIKRLTAAGCLGVIEHNDGFLAYYPEDADIKAIENDLALVKALVEKSRPSESLAFAFTRIPDQDWNETWKKDFHAIDIGTHFTVLPPWEERKQGRINLVIDPAMAFGTGHHETTRSCLVLMDKYAPDADKDRFLDLGTGTGILAMAAAKLGYRHVTGVDTDELAVDAAKKNIALNGEGSIDIRKGTLDALEVSYDFITANIISSVLVVLAPQLSLHLKPGGLAVLSGILREQDTEVIEAMSKAGLTLIERYPDGKWVSLVVSRRATA